MGRLEGAEVYRSKERAGGYRFSIPRRINGCKVAAKLKVSDKFNVFSHQLRHSLRSLEMELVINQFLTRVTVVCI